MATEKGLEEAPAEEVHGVGAERVEDKVAPPAEEEEKEDKEAPLPDDIVFKIIAALPSRDAYRISLLSKANERRLREPLFLTCHLAPRPLLVSDEATYIFVQPTDFSLPDRRPGYTHVTLVKVHQNTKQKVFFDLPRKDQKTGAIHSRPSRDATPAPDFFQQTLCLLDAEIVASHGRLLLARSATNYFVCNPERNRIVKLPLPTFIKPIWSTAAGFCYNDLDGSGKEIDINIVLLVRDRDTLVVQTLSSRVGTWVETHLGVNPTAKYLPPRSPGVFCDQRCYWLSQVAGHLVCFDKGTGSLSVVGQPPLADTHPFRFHASLGSTGGNLRFSCCDILDPHNKGGNLRWGSGARPIPAAMKVWKLNDAATGEWYQLYEDVMPLMYYPQDPMDFACASSSSIIVKERDRLKARNLNTGEDTFLISHFDYRYRSCLVFPYFG